ncbi:glycosyltransferase family 2 protein [Vibrio furnissii]|uniref:glycosyltransferase family 2 protein n=1 Tax=Vibrio furnissii TaxID=29494 RepID=UPI002572E400|nr:glycosyltransferase family 2 protein [Vibrio furnissii]WJG21760.1 glycosyltransferase family 2 protein [Vibrio furnissii]
MISYKNISAVVITYNPDIETLNALIQELLKQVKDVVIVDNSNSELDLKSKIPIQSEIVFLSDGRNKGIATAQNIGISYAKENDRDAVWIFDQDSELGGLSLEVMVNELNSFEGVVASIGPSIVNSFSNQVELPRKKTKNKNGTFCVDQIIASGSLTPVSVFDEVGDMEDALFIDAVDFEWCWRAKSLGYEILTSTQKMIHSVGEGDESILGGLIKIKVAAPFRLYYQVRNYFSLLKRNYVPLRWKVRNFFYYIAKYFYFGFLRDNSSEYRKNIISGANDGLKLEFRRK